jgi:hypothetical protein
VAESLEDEGDDEDGRASDFEAAIELQDSVESVEDLNKINKIK